MCALRLVLIAQIAQHLHVLVVVYVVLINLEYESVDLYTFSVGLSALLIAFGDEAGVWTTQVFAIDTLDLLIPVTYTLLSKDMSFLLVVVKGVSGALMAAGALLVPPGVSSCSPGTLTAASAFLGTAASPSLGASAIMRVLIAGVGQLNTLQMGRALFVRAA
ncbi:hypothetical protein RHS03_07782, partial [Rhizoctonia solani]